ncbi:hypothetical protein KJ980_02960 [Patescibacteria group bacterium]|nr:hypothetical protein [Patescibacteria group bacterium]MBU4098586.1 hypothetical protein [Patescibacteria group bacterium]
MEQVIQLSQSQFETLLQRLSRLEKMVAKLLVKEEEPMEGTDEWWEWSDKKALEEIKKGEYYELKDKKELDDFFNNIIKEKSNKKYDHKIRQNC